MEEYQLNPKFVTVITTEQGHIVLMPNGVRLPGMTKIVTNDTWGEIPTVEVTMQCNLAQTGVELDLEKTPMELAHEEEVLRHLDRIGRLLKDKKGLEQENADLKAWSNLILSKWWFKFFSKFYKTVNGKVKYPVGYNIDWDKRF